MLRAVLFDLDGTLVDSERENAESVARVLERRGRPVTAYEREFIIGHGWREIYAKLEQNRPTGLTFDELKQASANEKERLVLEAGLRVLPGAKQAMQRLSSRCKVAVVTGSARQEAEFCLRLMGVRDLVVCLVASEDVPRGKPSPDGFLSAASSLGVTPAGCLVLEDSFAGIAAARAAGMRCVAVRAGNFAGQDQAAADVVIESLLELDEPLLARLYPGS
jgi:sugar-phosphatase